MFHHLSLGQRPSGSPGILPWYRLRKSNNYDPSRVAQLPAGKPSDLQQ
jgi:hypothetical protein